MSTTDIAVPVVPTDAAEPVPEEPSRGSLLDDSSTPSPADHLVRRFRQALSDLRVEGVPCDWATPTPDGVAFASLNLRQADALTRLLEALAAAYESPIVNPAGRQLFEVLL